MATTTNTSASATGSAVSALMTSLGSGSGIDMAALANNLATAQFAARSDMLSDRSDKLTKQISAASTLKSMMLSLSTSLGERVRQGDLSPQPQVAPQASGTTVASAALSGSGTPTGRYALEVTALAQGQVLASPAYDSSASTVGAGTLTLRFGATSAGSFAEDTGHAAVSVSIAAGATLADVASAISGSNAGVSAYVASTPTGARLVLKGADGSANGFVLDATEDGAAPGLAALAWSPGGAAGRLVAGASDAAVKIDGLAIAAEGNTVADAIPGVTLKFTGTNAGAPTQVTFADPSSAITTAMQDLTSALNAIAGELKTDTDMTTGDLARDTGARSLRGALAQVAGKVVMPGAAQGTPRTLADLGLATQRDGSFKLDTTRLAATLKSDPQGAAAMFTNGLYGVFATVDTLTRAATSAGDPGSLGGSLTRLAKQQTQVATDKTTLVDRQEALRAQLVARFSTTNTAVGNSKSTLSFLQNQVAAWNKG